MGLNKIDVTILIRDNVKCLSQCVLLYKSLASKLAKYKFYFYVKRERERGLIVRKVIRFT